MSSSLEKLQERAAQLAAQLASMEAKLKEEKRRTDARRKILMGAALLSAYEKDPVKIRPFVWQLVQSELNERDRRFVQSIFEKTAPKESPVQSENRQTDTEDLEGFFQSED